MLQRGPKIYLWIKHCTTSGVYLSSIYMYVHFCCGLCDKLFQLIFSFHFSEEKKHFEHLLWVFLKNEINFCWRVLLFEREYYIFCESFFFFFFIKHCFMILVVIMSYMNSKIQCFLYNENRPS